MTRGARRVAGDHDDLKKVARATLPLCVFFGTGDGQKFAGAAAAKPLQSATPLPQTRNRRGARRRCCERSGEAKARSKIEVKGNGVTGWS